MAINFLKSLAYFKYLSTTGQLLANKLNKIHISCSSGIFPAACRRSIEAPLLFKYHFWSHLGQMLMDFQNSKSFECSSEIVTDTMLRSHCDAEDNGTRRLRKRRNRIGVSSLWVSSSSQYDTACGCWFILPNFLDPVCAAESWRELVILPVSWADTELHHWCWVTN